MEIEDAIRRYENYAKDDRIDLRIRKEHEQIAEWLKELQRLRALISWERCPDTNGQ